MGVRPAILATILVGVMSVPAVAQAGFTVQFDSHDEWIARANARGFTYGGFACDFSNRIAALEARLDGFQGNQIVGLSGECESIHVTVPRGMAVRPGVSGGNITATNAVGAKARGEGTVRFTFLPYTATDVPGFPDLSAYPSPIPLSSIATEFVVDSEGVVKADRLTWNGRTYHDTFTSYLPDPTDHLITQSMNLGVGTGRISVDGHQVWSGLLLQQDMNWWHVAAI